MLRSEKTDVSEELRGIPNVRMLYIRLTKSERRIEQCL